MNKSEKADEKYKRVMGDLKYMDRSLAIACTRGREAVVSRFRTLLHKQKLSEQQWRVLRLLCDQNSLTAVEISARSCIHKVSISRILKSLEQRNMVKRIASTSDLRASYVVLTDHGTVVMAPLLEESTKINKGIVEAFGYEDYDKLLVLLRKLAHIND